MGHISHEYGQVETLPSGEICTMQELAEHVFKL